MLTACSKSPPPPLTSTVAQSSVEAAQNSPKKRGDGKTKDARGVYQLMVDEEKGLTPVVNTLLDQGADANEKEPKQGKTALMLAAENGHPTTVQALLAKGAEAQEKDTKGNTALLGAAEKGHTAVVQAL